MHFSVLNRFLIPLFALAFILGCSSTREYHAKKTPPPARIDDWKKKNYSAESHEEFSKIEKMRALKKYREKREWARKNPEKFKKQRERLYKRARKQARRQQQQKERPSSKSREKFPPLTEDKKTELKQNIRYFCIQHQEEGPWQKMEGCLTFGREKMKKCEKLYQNRRQKDILGCLKAKLKL